LYFSINIYPIQFEIKQQMLSFTIAQQKMITDLVEELYNEGYKSLDIDSEVQILIKTF